MKKEKKHGKKGKNAKKDKKDKKDTTIPAAPPTPAPLAAAAPLRLRVAGGKDKSYIQEKSGDKWLLLCNQEGKTTKDHKRCVDLVMEKATQILPELAQCDFEGRRIKMTELRDQAIAYYYILFDSARA